MRAHKNDLRAVQSQFVKNDWSALPGHRNHIQCGVLVPILANSNWDCILTQRNSHLREHQGEICFPGGKRDRNDTSLQATAVRETREELGMSDGDIIMELSSVPLYTSDYRLVPFLALFSPDVEIQPNPEEVSHVLHISLQHALSMDFWDGCC